MVNKNRSAILTILKSQESPVTGEEIAKEIKVSRVAVWKQIKSLQEMGYPIESSKKGYRLEFQPDVLNPLEFAESSSQVFSLKQTTSTMDAALDIASSNWEEESVVFADFQTAGRAHNNTNWDSPQGNLYATMMTKPHIPAPYYLRILHLASICWSNALEKLINHPVQIEWPGSLMVKDQKIGGILVETMIRGDIISFANVGMGINIATPQNSHRPTTSLTEYGTSIKRKELFNQFKEEWNMQKENLVNESLIFQWNHKSYLKNKIVKGFNLSDFYRGEFTGIDHKGFPLIKQNNSTISVTDLQVAK